MYNRKDEHRPTIHLIQKSEKHILPSLWYIHIKIFLNIQKPLIRQAIKGYNSMSFWKYWCLIKIIIMLN